MRDPMRTGEDVGWRASVLRGVLTVAAALAFPLSLATVLGRASRGSVLETLVVMSVGVLLPALRLAPGLSVAARAVGVIVVLYAIAAYLLTRIGFTPGIFLVFTTAATLAAIYLGRRFGLAVIGLSATATVVIGILVTRGHLVLTPGDLDTSTLRNWIRITFTTTMLSALLTLTVDVVIRHVESGARQTQEALLQLAALHDKLEAAKEDERRFLAHELHDELGQMLTVLKFRLQIGGGPTSSEAVALIDDIIARVRKMSVGLRPPLLDEVGLVPALRAYLDGQALATGVAMVLSADPADDGQDGQHGQDRMSPDLEIACFRVVQESITNVLRHASARRIDVRIERRPNAISISIRDDGRGFDTAGTLGRAAADGHLGVVGMRERVRGRGGTFAVDSRPGAGTRITVELPLPS